MTRRPIPRRRGLPSAALIATAVMALGACTGSAGGDRATDTAPAPAGPPLAGAGRLVLAGCDPFAAPSPTTADGKVHVVTVTAYSTDGGGEVARRVATLPDLATSPTLCDATLAATGSAAADRQAFNADFSLLAGTVAPASGAAKRATAFTLPGGKAVGTAASTTGPGDDRRPLFQDGTSVLWYASPGRKLTSRDLAAAGAAPVERGALPGDDFALSGDRPWPHRPLDTKAEGVVTAPGGEVAAGYSRQHLVLWRAGDRDAAHGDGYVEPQYLGAGEPGRAVLPGSEGVPSCIPRLWLDSLQLLCGTQENWYRVVFAADFGRVERAEALLPPGRRFLSGAVLAPDGRSLAYVSTDGDAEAIQRLDLTPGATPVEVAELPPNRTTVQRRLVAWL